MPSKSKSRKPDALTYFKLQSEPPATEWASGLLGACPNDLMQTLRDPRFVELVYPTAPPINGTNTTDRDVNEKRCFAKRFSLDGGKSNQSHQFCMINL